MSSKIPFNSVMVVGVNTRPIVKSAKALGLKTIAVDCFGDIDLMDCADVLFSVKDLQLEGELKGSMGENLYKLSMDVLETQDVDAILFASGIEHNQTHIKELGKRAEIIGNKNSRFEFCKDKEKLFRLASELGIPHPHTIRVRKLDEALKAAGDIGYPIVLKPAFGGGGIGIKLIKSPEGLESSFKKVLALGDGETLYVQQYIRGVDASASLLSNGDEARCLTVNEQIIGDKRLNVPRRFGYCGNVIPLDAKKELISKIAEYSERICSEIKLLGSNGVDFVISDEPYLMEINPRFQNTIDCVEVLLGINLVKEHILSCRGELGKYADPKGYSAKLISYAKRDLLVPDLSKFQDLVDIPKRGSVIRRGKPICSILKFGEVRREVVTNAYSTAEEVQNFLTSKGSSLPIKPRP